MSALVCLNCRWTLEFRRLFQLSSPCYLLLSFNIINLFYLWSSHLPLALLHLVDPCRCMSFWEQRRNWSICWGVTSAITRLYNSIWWSDHDMYQLHRQRSHFPCWPWWPHLWIAILNWFGVAETMPQGLSNCRCRKYYIKVFTFLLICSFNGGGSGGFSVIYTKL